MILDDLGLLYVRILSEFRGIWQQLYCAGIAVQCDANQLMCYHQLLSTVKVFASELKSYVLRDVFLLYLNVISCSL